MWPFNRKIQEKASSFGGMMARSYIGRPVWPARSFKELACEAYHKNPIVFVCIWLISCAAADVDLKIVDKSGETINNPNIQAILDRANPMQDGKSFIHQIISDMMIGGNAFIEMVSVGGRPLELYRLRPDLVKVVPGSDGFPRAYEVSGTDGETRIVPVDIQKNKSTILHIKTYSPNDLWYGASPLDPAAFSIDAYTSANAWNKALLDNSAQPSGALIYAPKEGSQNLSEDQYAELKRQLGESMTGSANSGKPLLLEGGLQWQEMGFSPVDMAYAEGKASAARDIALCLGVPPLMLGIPGDNTYANFSEANKAFYRQTVLPHMNKLCSALSWWFSSFYQNIQIVTDTDNLLVFSDEREAHWGKVETSGCLTINEKRLALGFQKIDGGDVLLVGANLLPLADVGVVQNDSEG